ncbi:hypothetical protein PECL_869 [Pediococcus claussenii ATCC BAA-344]|uniref:Uncharacterized protein n=1 Tax=Pediococcus claussenii (strain ATCC BAA-344 / DSM 14800 / JCM 18046 / KCTC 3811 / LMG 21948 / P06) TaxID=701521 RepID=G8PD06_PEDCP|nr:hypothetical protein PECL_869 [Pediococcus claussenii ATCC BAA-344]
MDSTIDSIGEYAKLKFNSFADIRANSFKSMRLISVITYNLKTT